MINLPETATWQKAEQSPAVPWELRSFPNYFLPHSLSRVTYIPSLRLPENKSAVLQQRSWFSLLFGFMSIPEDVQRAEKLVKGLEHRFYEELLRAGGV